MRITRNERGLAHFALDGIDESPLVVPTTSHLPHYAGHTRGKKCSERLPPNTRARDLVAFSRNTSAFIGHNIHNRQVTGMPQASAASTALATSAAMRRSCHEVVREGRLHNKTRGHIPSFGKFTLYQDEAIRKHVDLKYRTGGYRRPKRRRRWEVEDEAEEGEGTD